MLRALAAALLILANIAAAAELTVSAAASLTNAFQDIGKAYEKTNPADKVRFNFGASGSLLQQIARGAPVDVLLRPDDILHDDASPLQARVLHKAFRGAAFLYTLQLPGGGRVLSLVPMSFTKLRSIFSVLNGSRWR